jgi:hypothetical protein
MAQPMLITLLSAITPSRTQSLCSGNDRAISALDDAGACSHPVSSVPFLAIAEPTLLIRPIRYGAAVSATEQTGQSDDTIPRRN